MIATKNTLRKNKRFIRASITAVLSCALASISYTSSSWAGGWQHYKPHAKPSTCVNTTRLMQKACGADIVDDFYEQSAKCLNADDPRSCKFEAYDGYREARADCRDQARGRNHLCERLPDAGPYITHINPDDFNGENGTCAQPGGQNRYFPLTVGAVYTYVSVEDEETIVFTVTDETREIQGVETIVVRDTVYDSLPDDNGNIVGERIEDTDDYYAIHANCDVWYFGEVSQNFEDGFLDNLDGSFIAGVNSAQAGIIMLGDPQVGAVYRQEFALGDAEDAGEVLDLNANVDLEVSGFACNFNCLKTEDFIANEDAVEYKYYIPGIGFVAEQLPNGEVELELISVTGL
nr:hypothetical protein [uncultured bacterium]